MPAKEPQASTRAWHRWAERERSCSQWLHRASDNRSAVGLLTAVSRLSNGMIWYAAILVLPWVTSPEGTACALRMTLLGLVNLALYKVFKRHFARPRPFVECPGIRECTPSLDEYSFPSGHVLHAVGFSVILCAYFPGLSWILWPFGLLVALSRVVLGLHYPSDVVVGAAMGWLTATSILVLF
jgi:undecaprenyl-diphosphatase